MTEESHQSINDYEQQIKGLEFPESVTLDQMPENIKLIESEMQSQGKVLNWITNVTENNDVKSVTFFLHE